MEQQEKLQDGESLKVRGYQQEMFERSLKGNSIVVVGSVNEKSNSLLNFIDGYRQWENIRVCDIDRHSVQD
jgi:hypothetical protein